MTLDSLMSANWPPTVAKLKKVGPACRAGLRGLPRPEYTPSAKSPPNFSGNAAQVRLR